MIAAYDLNRDDYFAFIEHLQRPNRYAVVKIGLILFLGMVVPIFFVAVSKQPARGFGGAIAMIAVFVFVVALLYMIRQMRRMARTLRSEELIMAFCGRRELSLEPDALVETSPSRQIAHRWTSVEQIAKTEKYLFVHSPGYLVSVIPGRAFESEQAFDALAHKVAEQTGKAIVAE